MSWLRCRVLSFLGSAFFDDVRQQRERYANPAIELVAEEDGEIVGLVDVECEQEPGAVCEERPGLGGMIWHLAVHPDHQRHGVAAALVDQAERLAAARGIVRFEAWTRDDPDVQRWYESHGFERIYSYLHVYVELDEGLRDLWPVIRTTSATTARRCVHASRASTTTCCTRSGSPRRLSARPRARARGRARRRRSRGRAAPAASAAT